MRFFILIFLILVGCQTNLQKLKDMRYDVGKFELELANEYLEFSDSEADQYDWIDSDYFAKKAILILKGNKVKPEEIDNWNIKPDVIPTIIQARRYLLKLLDDELIENYPVESAKAVFYFDCWLEQQEENWQTTHIEYCREEFYSHLDKLFSASVLNKDLEREIEQIGVDDSQALNKLKLEKKLEIFFRFDSYGLSRKSIEQIENFYNKLMQKNKEYEIIINGFTDLIGDEKYNLELSKKRANIVKEYLINLGVNQKKIITFAYGKGDKNSKKVEILLNIKD